MTIIGIAGCTALLVAGLGLKQSIISIVGRQYGDIFRYDLEVTVKEGRADNIEGDTYIKNFLEVSKENIKAIYGEEQRETTLLTIPDLSHMSEFINLKDRESQESLALEDNGVIISEKLAKLLKVGKGDTIQFESSDLVIYDVKVIGITENYVGHYIYMTEDYAKQIRTNIPSTNQLLIHLVDSSGRNEEAISNKLTQNENVVSFTFTTKHADSFNSMTSSLDTVVIILIVSAALLAFVVLYNLTTINISERYRR